LIEEFAAVLSKRGVRREVVAAQPFLAVALKRSGEREKALQVIERAATDLPSDSGWLTKAAVFHTRSVLLAELGSPVASAALAYGDSLALALWRQRQRTLHTASTMKSYDRLRDEHERVARIADMDSLTGVANRRAFDQAVESVSRSGDHRRIAVLLVDLDTFKQINDTMGHAAGDTVLRAVASVLAGLVRDGDLVARLGGDEFGALLYGAGPGAAKAVAERMVLAIDGLEDCDITVSVGVASGATADIHSMWRAADSAMYVAKRAGGNRAHPFVPAA
jgi:diguanylate cyclase (GGDEF)-like protein